MAEVVTHLAIQDITSIKFKDAAGSPLEYTVKPTEGTIDLIQGGYNRTIATDAMGVPISGAAARQSGVASMCGIRFACKLFDIGDNAETAEYTLLDLLDNDGVVGSGWAETTTSPDASMFTWNIVIVVANRTLSGGTNKGATITIPNVAIEGGGYTINITRDGGFMLDATWRSDTAVRYTKARTA